MFIYKHSCLEPKWLRKYRVLRVVGVVMGTSTVAWMPFRQNKLVWPRWKCWFVLKNCFFCTFKYLTMLGWKTGGSGPRNFTLVRSLQHSKDLTLTDDALMGITWAALRIGVSGRDWVLKWLEILSHHGLPGKDFVILAPSHDLKSFKDLVANFYHSQSMLRTLLLHSGFTTSEAMTFSCHSWRHLFPTAGRQLRLSNETLNDMGHWVPNSGMPQRYDSAACVSELTGKATLRQAFQGGWSMVGPVASQDSHLLGCKKANNSTRQGYRRLSPCCVRFCRFKTVYGPGCGAPW